MGEDTLTTSEPVRRRWWRRESNPLLVKELRGRMRGARAFVILTVYLLILSCFTSVIYYAYRTSISGPGGGSNMAYLGKVVFSSVVIMEIFMVVFLTPAFTASAISGERERKTYEVLRTTLLSARKLIFGKLTPALIYILLLVLVAVPLESLAFVLGGVVIQELALALLILLVAAFFFAAVGLFCSAYMRTTLAATVLAYVLSLLLTIGVPALILILLIVTQGFSSLAYGGSGKVPLWLIEAIAAYLILFLISFSPLATAVGTEFLLIEEDALFYYWQSLDSSRRVLLPSPWLIYTVIYITLALLFLLLAILRTRKRGI